LRTLILVSFTLFVLTMGFVVYWWVQPAKRAGHGRNAAGGPAPRLAQRETEKPYGPGKGVWVKRYSEETAAIISRFKADEYKPRNDGWVEVRNPRAQFFMKDGRAITVEGDTGEVILDDKAKRTGMKALSGSQETPSRGRLHHVRVRLFHDVVDPEVELEEGRATPKLPALTVTLNNAAFDNQTFRIYSEAYREGRTRVDGDQVPIVLLGEDYNFWGRGLTIRWNERDQRLQLLEIAHGERLEIKHPDQLMKKEEEIAEGRRRKAEGRDEVSALPVMLAARTRTGAGEAVKADQQAPVAQGAQPAAGEGRGRSRAPIPKPKITPSDAPPLYRAIFHERVKVAQGTDLLVDADKLSIDFLLEDQGGEEGAATTRPAGKKGGATRATTQQAAAAAAVGSGSGKTVRRARRTAATQGTIGAAKQIATTQATTGAVHVIAATQPAAAATQTALATTQPTTRPSRKRKGESGIGDQPVVITWVGKLVVEPLAVGTENPLNSGEAVIRLDGKPVRAQQQESVVECGTLVYRTEDQAMLLTPVSPDRPVVMTDAKGAVVRTARMDYSQPKRVATLYGMSDAVFPQFDENGKAAQPVLAKWSKTCTLYFVGEKQSEMNIERAELDGDVAVDHTQLKLRSQGLDLVFEPQGATTKPTTQVAATQIATTQAIAGAIARATTGPTSKPSTRPAVRADLRQMVATGTVHCEMMDEKQRVQTIECDRLALLTAKTPDGRIYPSTINADGSVRTVDPDQELRAGHMAITLKPTTKPTTRAVMVAATQASSGAILASSSAGSSSLTPPLSRGEREQNATTKPADTAGAELQSLVAHKDVSVVTKEGSRIWADQLLVDNKGGQNVIKLLGGPARVVDPKNSLSGPIIEIYPDAQRLEVFGAGVMKGVQQEKAGDPARPVDVTWTRGLMADGKANTVDVSGQVVAVSTDERGAVNTAKGEHVKMALVDVAPATKPATTQVATTQASASASASDEATKRRSDEGKANATTQPTTKPSRSSQYAGMSNKSIRKVTFSDGAQISSVTMAEDGSLLRRMHLEAAVVEHDMVAKKMVIPVEGRMVVEDHVDRSATKPSTAPTTNSAENRAADTTLTTGGFGGGDNPRGTTAFGWSKSFTYDDAGKVAVMEGTDERPVIIAHRDDSADAKTFHLTGQVVTAEMEEVVASSDEATKRRSDEAATQASTKPTTKPVEKKEQTKMQLKRVTANGRLAFSGPGVEVHSRELEFDPKSNVVTARGDGRTPVVFDIATSPGGQKEAEMIRYDLKSGRILEATRVNVRLNRGR
jgi:hypothetical protein